MSAAAWHRGWLHHWRTTVALLECLSAIAACWWVWMLLAGGCITMLLLFLYISRKGFECWALCPDPFADLYGIEGTHCRWCSLCVQCVSPWYCVCNGCLELVVTNTPEARDSAAAVWLRRPAAAGTTGHRCTTSSNIRPLCSQHVAATGQCRWAGLKALPGSLQGKGANECDRHHPLGMW